jgi:hypothetical protein
LLCGLYFRCHDHAVSGGQRQAASRDAAVTRSLCILRIFRKTEWLMPER